MEVCHFEPTSPSSGLREWVTHRVLGSSLLVFIFFSARHMFLTSRGDLLASFGYSFSVSKSPVSCRSKGQAGRKLQEQTTTASLRTACKGARWDSRPTMCPRPMFTSSVEALPFPGPSQYFGAEKESVIWGLAVYCVWLWFMLRCTNSLVVNTPARASKLSGGGSSKWPVVDIWLVSQRIQVRSRFFINKSWRATLALHKQSRWGMMCF